MNAFDRIREESEYLVRRADPQFARRVADSHRDLLADLAAVEELYRAAQAATERAEALHLVGFGALAAAVSRVETGA